jgi:phosphoglycerate kinase
MQDTNKKTIEDISVNGKKCLVRCDFNVPIKDGIITDDKRIREALKTIRYLVNNDAKVILCSHLGRPKGTFNATYSLKPVAVRLSELLGQKVEMAEDVVGKDAKAKSSSLTEGQILLLENLRFDPR